MDLKEYSKEEISQHNQQNDCWIIIDGLVYDVTKFLPLHPAGKHVMKNYLGTDATEIFNYFHHELVKDKYKQLVIGKLKGQQPEKKVPIFDFPLSDKEASGIPFGDDLSVQGWNSPYYNEYHKQFRKALRKFVKEEITPFANEWEEQGHVPKELLKRAGDLGLIALTVGKPWNKENFPNNTVTIMGMDLEGKLDTFFELILHEEILNQNGFGGPDTNLFAGNTIGIPPILWFGSDYLKQKVLKPCFFGIKRCCLAITEPFAGSDVAKIKTTAVKSQCGKFYIVNGIKKWITNGFDGDFFTTAVKTGDDNMMGISLLLLERNMPGIIITKMKCQSLWSTGTSLLVFQDVKVPVENLIGSENEGFKLIMMNFNHERLYICMQGAGTIQNVMKTMMQYVHKRKTFGKPLIEQPVIRAKLAHMMRLQMTCKAQLENIIYNFDNLNPKLKMQILPPSVAILKASCTNAHHLILQEALQILGGNGYTRGGIGVFIEKNYRETRATAILGGSEEIMLDLGIKLSSRYMPGL